MEPDIAALLETLPGRVQTLKDRIVGSGLTDGEILDLSNTLSMVYQTELMREGYEIGDDVGVKTVLDAIAVSNLPKPNPGCLSELGREVRSLASDLARLYIYLDRHGNPEEVKAYAAKYINQPRLLS